MSTSDTNVGPGGGGAPGPGGAGTGAVGISVSSSGSGVATGGTTTTGGVAAKLTHVKATTLDAASASSVAAAASSSATTGIGGGTALTLQQGLIASPASITAVGNTIMTTGGAGGIGVSGGVVTAPGTIKVATGNVPSTTTLSLNNAQSGTATAIRAIGAGGQSTQVRVVVPTTITTPSMFKLEGATGGGRTQITAIPAAAARTVSNTSITVTRPMTQTTYLPRAAVTATQMAGVGVGVAPGQRLVTPIRATTGGIAGTVGACGVANSGAGTTVTGLTAAGSFVRGTAVNRNSNSPATTVISPATSTTWMAANTSGHMQFIRTVPNQSRQRIITTTQGINSAGIGVVGSSAGGTVSGTVVATTGTPLQAGVVQGVSAAQQATGATSATIQTVTGATVSHNQPPPQSVPQSQQQQQQTYVATVLPQRQHPATLVYSSNVSTTQPQQFSPTVATGQRFAAATPLNAATGTGSAPRQIRSIPLGKPLSTAKLNTTSISIRAPNIPQLTPALASAGLTGTTVGTVSASGATTVNVPRSTTVTGVTGNAGNVIPTTNLSTARFIQLQQQPGATTRQIIGPTGQFAGNVMLHPIFVNTTGGSKIAGLRPPGSMTAKVQPALTITQLGIGKLPAATAGAGGVAVGAAATPGSGTTTQNVTASIQAISGGVLTAPSLAAASSNLAGSGVTNVSNVTGAAGGGAQLVSVSQASQLLSTQNLASSAVAAASGGTTVLPLAITTRGGASGNILSGTITPLKTGNSITVGKVVAQAQVSDAAAATTSTGTTSVYIQHAGSGAVAQRAHGGTGGVTVAMANAPPASASSTGNTVLTSTAAGGGSTSAFLQPGSTIYYESVPASSVQVSTGVLSLTTTTVTSSTHTQNQLGTTTAGLATISALPYAAAASAAGAGVTAPSTATFTVMPTGGGRTIGQLQIPVSSAGTQIQAVPVRFSAQLGVAQGGNTVSNNNMETINVSQATTQILTAVSSSGGGQQITANANAVAASQPPPPPGQHMVIPLSTSIKVTNATPTTTNVGTIAAVGTSVVPNFLRKRDAEGSPKRAAKNLAPTLLAMPSNNATTITVNNSNNNNTTTIANNTSSNNNNNSNNYNLSGVSTVSILTAEALAKKDRAAAAANTAAAQQYTSRAASPASSDGSTTVSANSSPGVDQQICNVMNRMPSGIDATHFNPINELYANHQNVSMHHNVPPSAPTTSRSAHQPAQLLAAVAAAQNQRMNGGPIDGPPRKRARRSTNDSQHSTQSQPSYSLPPPAVNNVNNNNNNNNNNSNNNNNNNNAAANNNNINNLHNVNEVALSNGNYVVLAMTPNSTHDGNQQQAATNNSHHKLSNNTATSTGTAPGNKENAKPAEYVLRRPQNFTLMHNYKISWKAANNHFQRYSEVKPREDRRPTVIDLANQANVLGKINGWKIYHLRAQMEDLCENESTGYDLLSTMLKYVDEKYAAEKKNTEIERLIDLLKGNMQRSKIIIDGVNDAQNQIMKIFEHKSHVSDIIQRCASKRNFKKREKL